MRLEQRMNHCWRRLEPRTSISLDAVYRRMTPLSRVVSALSWLADCLDLDLKVDDATNWLGIVGSSLEVAYGDCSFLGREANFVKLGIHGAK